MNINRFNINYIIIKNDKFNIDYLKCNIDDKTIIGSYINIEYESLYFKLDGLYLETSNTLLFNNFVLINNSKNKYLFNIPLLENEKFNNIFTNIDKKLNNIISKTNSILTYENTIKENTITIDNNEYEYKFINAILNSNECNITLDNNIFTGDLEELDYNKLQMKYILNCYGLCKTEKHLTLSWKILKLDLITKNVDFKNYKNILFKKINNKVNKDINKDINKEINLNNVEEKKNYLIKTNNVISDDLNINYNNISNNNISSKDDEYIYIPNFELELENIDDD